MSCHHIEFGHVNGCIGVSSRKPPILGSAGPSLLGVDGVVDPLKTRSSPACYLAELDALPYGCRKHFGDAGAHPLRWGVADPLKYAPPHLRYRAEFGRFSQTVSK